MEANMYLSESQKVSTYKHTQVFKSKKLIFLTDEKK